MRMNKTDLAYLSGCSDGESCICISKSKHNNYRASFAVAMNNVESILLFQRLFGGNLRIGNKKSSKTNVIKHNQYIISYSDMNKVKQILQALLPYLKVKKEQAKLTIEFIDLKLQNNQKPITPTLAKTLKSYYNKVKREKKINWIKR